MSTCPPGLRARASRSRFAGLTNRRFVCFCLRHGSGKKRCTASNVASGTRSSRKSTASPISTRRLGTPTSSASASIRASPGVWTSMATMSCSGKAAAYAIAACPCPQPISRTTGALRPNAAEASKGPSGRDRDGARRSTRSLVRDDSRPRRTNVRTRAGVTPGGRSGTTCSLGPVDPAGALVGDDSGAPDGDDGAVVAEAGRGLVAEPLGEPLEAGADERLGPAEHAVDAVDEGLVTGLDDAVAVEHERVTATDRARLTGVVGMVDDTEQRPAPAGEHPPPAGTRRELGGRRVAGIPDGEVAGLEVDGEVYGRREALVPAQPQQVVVGGLEEATLAHLPQQAAERTGEQQRAGACLATLARDVDQGDLEGGAVGGAARHDEVTGEPVAVGGLEGDLGPPRRGQRRQLTLGPEPVPHVDEHGLATDPDDADLRAGVREPQHDRHDGDGHDLRAGGRCLELTEIDAEARHREEEADVDDEQQTGFEEEAREHDDERVHAPWHVVRPDGDRHRRGDAQPEEGGDENPRCMAQPRTQLPETSCRSGGVARAPRDDALDPGHVPPRRDGGDGGRHAVSSRTNPAKPASPPCSRTPKPYPDAGCGAPHR